MGYPLCIPCLTHVPPNLGYVHLGYAGWPIELCLSFFKGTLLGSRKTKGSTIKWRSVRLFEGTLFTLLVSRETTRNTFVLGVQVPSFTKWPSQQRSEKTSTAGLCSKKSGGSCFCFLCVVFFGPRPQNAKCCFGKKQQHL